MDLGLALFQSNGDFYAAGRDQAAALSDAAGPGGSETFDFTASADDWYGLLAFNNSAQPAGPTGSFTVQLEDLGAAAPSPPRPLLRFSPPHPPIGPPRSGNSFGDRGGRTHDALRTRRQHAPLQRIRHFFLRWKRRPNG